MDSIEGSKNKEIKLVIKSIIPLTTHFTQIIKNQNDSSMDEFLEFRSLMSDSFITNPKPHAPKEIPAADKSYSEDIKQFILQVQARKEEMERPDADESTKCDDSGCKSTRNDSNRSINDLQNVKKPKTDTSLDGSEFSELTSSTPIKSGGKKIDLNISGVGFLNYSGKVRKRDGSLNDSDFESMDQDQYEDVTMVEKICFMDCSSVNTEKEEKIVESFGDGECCILKENYSVNSKFSEDFKELGVSDSGHEDSSEKSDNSNTQKEETKEFESNSIKTCKKCQKSFETSRKSLKTPDSTISKSSSFSDMKNSVMSLLDETIKKTPMVIRKAFTRNEESFNSPSLTKKSKFLNLFSTGKRRKNSSKKRRKKSCAKKKIALTKENLEKLENAESETRNKENVEWGDNFEYSFLCEPSTSDIENDLDSSNYVSYNTSLDSSIEMLKSPLIPIFKIDPPTSDASSFTSSISIKNSTLVDPNAAPPACDYVRHLIKCSYANRVSLRRSMSDSWSFPNNEIQLENDCESVMEIPMKPSTFKSLQASIRGLTKLSVSFFSFKFIFFAM